jgi:hypothetical protein
LILTSPGQIEMILPTIFSNDSGTKTLLLLGSYNTFQKDAVIRELGKVFGLPAHEIDKLQREKDLENLRFYQ